MSGRNNLGLFIMATRIGKINREGRLNRVLHGEGALPTKQSSTAAARIDHARESGCSICFPHGPETTNRTIAKNERTWKRSRKTPYRR